MVFITYNFRMMIMMLVVVVDTDDESMIMVLLMGDSKKSDLKITQFNSLVCTAIASKIFHYHICKRPGDRSFKQKINQSSRCHRS